MRDIISQNLGQQPFQSGEGPRADSYCAITAAKWFRVYDLIGRLWSEFDDYNLRTFYIGSVNNILASHGCAWKFTEDGEFVQVLPGSASKQIQGAIQELGKPEFKHALEQFQHGLDAHNDVPRRDRDACANAFDAMESVAKIVANLSGADFGKVTNHLSSTGKYGSKLLGSLSKLDTLANTQFRHGTQFTLKPSEVEWVFLTCTGGILLFTR